MCNVYMTERQRKEWNSVERRHGKMERESVQWRIERLKEAKRKKREKKIKRELGLDNERERVYVWQTESKRGRKL